MLDLVCQYYDSKGEEFIKLNPVDLRHFFSVPDKGVFHGETRIPKVVTFTETKQKNSKPPTFGHTHMPNLRGMSLGGSGGNEAIEELIKPHYGKDHLSGTTVQDD